VRFKRIDILNAVLVLVVGLFIFLFSCPEYKYLTGWLVGGLAGMVYFWLIRYSLARPLVIKSKRYTRCKIARFAMMGVLVAVAAMFPQHLNVICLIIGFMVNKVSIIIMEGIIPGKGSVRKDVNAK
jgi:hypothetical protein